MAQIQGSRGILLQLGKTCSGGDITKRLLFSGQRIRGKKTLTKVILTENVDRLGRAGETVAVAPGYFRNYLMPNLLAVPNVDKYALLVKEQIKLRPPDKEVVVEEDQSAIEGKMKDYIKAANILADAHLLTTRCIKERTPWNKSLRRFITTEKELRTPVTKEELVEEVGRQLSVAIQPENLQLQQSLSSLGEYEVPLRLPRQIPLPEGIHSWTLRVKIRKK